MTALSTIRNIGPAMELAFQDAGIGSAEELREIGPDAAYKRLLTHGHRPHFIAYYALVMGLQGRPWNDCQGKEKSELRRRFDALVKSTELPAVSTLVQALDELGIRTDPSDTQS